VTLSGYGIAVRVDRGHLVLQDGICGERREARLPRVGHGLKRLVVIGSDGMVSLAALRWLTDQKAALVVLDRHGHVIASTGGVRSPDGRLRRAQALALQTDVGMAIIRLLIDQKLGGQERLAGQTLKNPSAATAIAAAREALRTAKTTDAVRWIEGTAALAYWSAWHALPVGFPQRALRRVPQHWRVFGARRSPLTGSPRLAVNPANAMLNYLYAVVESEARLAAVAVGLDSSMGLLHADTDARHSLACDLMEPIRPQVDAYVLDWLTREPVPREWFFEQRDGSCRLMNPFATRLAETAPTWARAVAPIAERVAQMLWDTVPRSKARLQHRAIPLTERHRRDAKSQPEAPVVAPLPPPSVCRGCGLMLQRGRRHCNECARAVASEAFPLVMEEGRIAAQRPEARARRAETQRLHERAKAAWRPSEQPAWLTPEAYAERIQPRLAALKITKIAAVLGVSVSYAAAIRVGLRHPHPRHWLALATLAIPMRAETGDDR
jgi:CRISPR-associated endonuclease Cas1